MNDVMERPGTSLAAPQRNVFEQYAEASQTNRIVGDLLKFSKGEYLAGQDGREIEEGKRLVANMDELMVGWVKWEDGKPADMRMGRIVEGFQPVGRASLGDTDKEEWEQDDNGQPRDPWQATNYLILKDPDGEQLYTFATSSKGGLGAIGKLCGAYGKAMRQRPDQFPVIALGIDSYRHPNKAYGKIYTPKFEIVGWTGKSAFAEALAAEAAEAAERAEDDIPFDGAVAPEPPRNGRGRKTATAETQF
ncbi:MAG: hypothetical protein K2X91_02465 [Thermoleophilia bacterium]|nr:hypothetical protein [Thermoleophilia bacterium]